MLQVTEKNDRSNKNLDTREKSYPCWFEKHQFMMLNSFKYPTPTECITE